MVEEGAYPAYWDKGREQECVSACTMIRQPSAISNAIAVLDTITERLGNGCPTDSDRDMMINLGKEALRRLGRINTPPDESG